ncbi:hypothetical protein XBFFL1_380009 [Xenorhabdus bovienii str. feltiae Florida]|uniref:Uncharacterized protein n=1 Tax=Xenorhabdus bovienii str. kraussei Becker Underwood TaxID=1398204 RepID=A0A077PRC5_XENBV|nr:hypothetical protein XBFFL1_380009 [Xenorhabdus bovienii str. feltiae Florida]CDH26875.1 hypothetical protein XBKB1_990013 [Xenorhabdus bovienii str. kraussei Becker Underwood]
MSCYSLNFSVVMQPLRITEQLLIVRMIHHKINQIVTDKTFYEPKLKRFS